MAILKPSLDDLRQLAHPLNPGELGVARELANLDDGWTVYVQPRLEHDVPDFVAVHRRHGVCAIEVKNWARAGYRQNDAGVIEYRRADGSWRTSQEQPRYQAFRYRSTIFDRFFALPSDSSTPTKVVRAVVVLPQYSNDDARKLLNRPAVTDEEHGIEVWGGDGLRQSIGRIVKGTGCPPPRLESLQRLERQLVRSEILTDLQHRAKLSAGARNIERNLSNARIRRVRGSAGSGKSFGLAARAARLASRGQSVLVLSFNITLAHYLRALVTARCNEYAANPTHVTCTTFHALCHRVVDDAERVGFKTEAPVGLPAHDAIVLRAEQSMKAGHGMRYDAVLVDEGQDFTLEWWNLLRHHVVVPNGEMLLVADPTQDVYGKRAWTDNDKMLGAGFAGSWTELKGSYRLPSDIVPIANAFATRYLTGERLATEAPDDRDEIVARGSTTRRKWFNIDRTSDLGRSIGHEVVRLLTENPHLAPSDVVFLCEHHSDGLDAVSVIEAAGYNVHHIFSTQDHSRSVRKRRFWPDADGIKGCTVHSFKGWETSALVMGIRRDEGSRRLAYVAMTRLA